MQSPYEYNYKWSAAPPTRSPPHSRSGSPPSLCCTPRSESPETPTSAPKIIKNPGRSSLGSSPGSSAMYSKRVCFQDTYNVNRCSSSDDESSSSLSSSASSSASFSPMKPKVLISSYGEQFAQTTTKQPSAAAATTKKNWSCNCGMPMITIVLYSIVLIVVGAGVSIARMATEVESVQYDWMVKYQTNQDYQTELYTKVTDLKVAYEHLFHRERSTNETIEQKQQETIDLWGHLDHLQGYAEQLHGAIQRHSRLTVLEKYGSGPHRVEIELSFQQDDDTTHAEEQKIIIELAPVTAMPHTVHLFLEQVERNLWDGTSFHTNADHVIQAGPVGNHTSPETSTSMVGNFRRVGLDKVLFREYNSDNKLFQHDPYTVGFAGNPGGPDFFISKRDGWKNHNPETTEDEDMDPCFAKVIDGFEAVERLNRAARTPGSFHMKHFVTIRNMKLLPS